MNYFKDTVIILLLIIICGIIWDSWISSPTSFVYNKHEYIQFKNGVIHNPECKECYNLYE